MADRLNIAYTPSGGSGWTGGRTYQANILAALKEYAPHVKVYFVYDGTGDPPNEEELRDYIRYPSNGGWVLDALNRLSLRFLGYDRLLSAALDSVPEVDIQLLFPGRFKAGIRRAVLYWIPDFQHLHIPEMYQKNQIEGLNKKFMEGIRHSTLVLLSSHDAQKDFCGFAPGFIGKTRVIHFVARIPSGLYDRDPRQVTGIYNLPDKFFYLPNQFWKHKNHITVFKALRILGKKGVKPFIVFTGNPVDSRNPLHFADLVQKISEWGLRDQVAFLGLVPHDHVYMLVRQSICVINPSLFEGWSTTVEEAKSVGKRVLLSNLPVHREQDPPGGVYFEPTDSEGLAETMGDLWSALLPGPDTAHEYSARAAFPGKVKAFAEAFVTITSEAVKMVRG